MRIAARVVSVCLRRPDATTIVNFFPAEIDEIRAVGVSSAFARLTVGGDYLLALVTRRPVARLDLRTGDQVCGQVESVTVRR